MLVKRSHPLWLFALLTCAGLVRAAAGTSERTGPIGSSAGQPNLEAGASSPRPPALASLGLKGAETAPPAGFRLEKAAAQATAETTAALTVIASFLPKEPLVDGDLGDWKVEPAFSLGDTRVHLGWTPRKLLLGVVVPDGSLVSTMQAETTSTDAAIFRLGNAEVFLSSSRGNRPVFRRSKFGQLDRLLFHRTRGPEGTFVAVRRQEDKGVVCYEAALPWHTIADALPACSDSIPFGFVLRDCRGETVTDVPLTGPVTAAGELRLALQTPPAPTIALRPSAARAVTGPGEDPEVYLSVYSSAPLRISSLAVSLDDRPLWTGDLEVQAGLTCSRLRGLGLGSGRNRLAIAMPGLAPQELDLVVLDRAMAASRLATVNQLLQQWEPGKAPALVARSAATATYLAGEVAELLARPRLSALLARRCLEELESLEGAARRLLDGKLALDGQTGLLGCAYRSALDGTLQPYSLFVPALPAPGTTMPLLVALPDVNETHSTFLASPELQEAARKHHFLVLSPFGRGLENSYRGPSEVDIGEVLEEVLALFPVDPSRIYVAGSEAGGTAALELALQSPDRFRGFGAVDAVADELSAFTREWRKEPVAWLASLLEARSALTHARNAAGMAVFLKSRPDDANAEQQANLLRELKDSGAAIWAGSVAPGQVNIAGLWEPMLAFFAAQSQPRPTNTISFTSSRLSRNRAWWVRADTVRVHGLDFTIRAERSQDGLFRADLQNLTEFSLSAEGTDLVTDAKALLTVDGQSLEVPVPADGWLRLRHSSESWSVASTAPVTSALQKKPGVEGPIEHAFMRPFLYVYADKGPDAGVAERAARESARLWEQRFNGRVTVVPESKLTKKDEQEQDLVLFGFPGSSVRLASLLSAVPARVTTAAIEIGETSFNGRPLGLQLVRPNPAAPGRYVVAVTGNAPAALQLLLGHDWRKPDYLVVGPGYAEDMPQSALGGGFFDLKWKP